MTEDAAVLEYYSEPGAMTDLRAVTGHLTDAPTDPAGIVAFVQGVLIHPQWAVAYDVAVPPERQAELQVRGADGILQGVLAADDRPLTERRDPADRFLGNCRDHSTLTVALLRRAGTTARARCGFAGYFEIGKWIDHWIVEYWNSERWVVLDAQIDDLQRELSPLADDPADLPPGLFLAAGDAWARCRRGDLDGDDFGIMDMWGLWFVAGNIGRDLAALNKIEMLPWDDWGSVAIERDTIGSDEAADARIDDLAAVLNRGDAAEIRARYEADADLQVPSTVMSLGPDGDWVPQAVVELG